MNTSTAALTIALLGFSGAAMADRDFDHDSNWGRHAEWSAHDSSPSPGGVMGGTAAVQAPEIDPASIVGGLTLLSGGLLLLRSRRRKR